MKLNFVQSTEPMLRQCQPKAIEVGENMRYTIKDAKIAENIFSTSFHTCSGFELNAGKMNLAGHIKPECFNPRNFADAFECLVKDFQDKFGEVKALVLGGRESSFVDPYSSVTSNEVYSTMCDVLSTKCNIPDEKFASILGKYRGIKTNDDIAIIGDKVFIANKEFEKLGISDASDKDIETIIGNVYEDVFIPSSFYDNVTKL